MTCKFSGSGVSGINIRSGLPPLSGAAVHLWFLKIQAAVGRKSSVAKKLNSDKQVQDVLLIGYCFFTCCFHFSGNVWNLKAKWNTSSEITWILLVGVTWSRLVPLCLT